MLSRNPIHLVSVLAMAIVAATSVRAELKVGDSFPALTPAGVVSLTGDAVPSPAGKVTLVDFWASWCPPCKASFPAMAKLHEEFSARGFQILAVSIDEKPAAATAFLKKMAPPFPALHDREQKLAEAVVLPTMPSSYLLDRAGHVRYLHAGFHGDLEQLRKEIETLLAEKA
jgi:thiol-disulfide isomerase/thioredoxin